MRWPEPPRRRRRCEEVAADFVDGRGLRRKSRRSPTTPTPSPTEIMSLSSGVTVMWVQCRQQKSYLHGGETAFKGACRTVAVRAERWLQLAARTIGKCRRQAAGWD